MDITKATTLERKDSRGSADNDTLDRIGRRPPTGGGGPPGDDAGGVPRQPGRPAGTAFFSSYKPEQGKYTRLGTFLAGGALVAWGAYFMYERLQVFQGDDWGSLLITTGIPLLVAAALGWLVWWVTYGNRPAGDFMIATEGEMKKVSWSTRREVIGSTKVVILFTFLFALYLFGIDVVFQFVFSALGVLQR